MPTKTIKQNLNSGTYFMTFTVLHWYYIFDRHSRWDILKESLNYCTKNKALSIYAYIFMLNHPHLIAKSHDMAGFTRDFKKYTAQELMRNLKKTEPMMADLFKTDDGRYRIWQKGNLPILLENDSAYYQKVEYIERNPVKRGYVERPEYWRYSSANPNSPVICKTLG